MIDTKDRFRALIKKYLKQKKIRQQRIAKELELTASAVSQMIKCKILFSLRQLNKICEVLALEPTQTFELQALLIRLRTGAAFVPSPFSRLLFALRCKRALSLRQLSNLTGLPTAKLRAFEEDENSVFSPDDAARLSTVLGCECRELMEAANLAMNSSFYSQPTPPEMLAAAEPGADYCTASMVKLLPLASLAGFHAGDSVFAFAAQQPCTVFAEAPQLPFPVVAVAGKAADFGLPGNCAVTLLLSDELRDGKTVLAARAGEPFALLEEVEKGKFAPLFRAETPTEGEADWALPVCRVIVGAPARQCAAAPAAPAEPASAPAKKIASSRKNAKRKK